MKALIVDDEKHVREAVCRLVPWEQFGIEAVLEAGSGEQAIELIRSERPVVIFTDMRMPTMDGAQLMEWIYTHAPEAKTIVMSGFADFDYVKPTIHYGGVDYLLKPLSREKLAAAAERAVRMWKTEQAERQRLLENNVQLNVLRPLYWDKAFSDLVSGQRSYAELVSGMEKEFGIGGEVEDCRVAVISLAGLDPAFTRKFHGDLALIAFMMTNVGNELLGSGQYGYAFRYWHSGVDVVMLLWREPAGAVERVERIHQAFHMTYGVEVAIGLSAVQSYPAGLAPAFGQAVQVLTEQGPAGTGSGIHVWSDSKDRQLIHDMKLFMNAHYQTEITLQSIAERFYLSKENVSRKFKQVTGENLVEYLSRVRIDKAKALLKNPLMRVSDIAEKVGFQDEKYFSRVFKKVTGMTPREYRKQSGTPMA